MRGLSLFAGLWLVAIGIGAVVDDDIAAQACWLVAGALVAGGLSGLLATLRRPAGS